MANIALQVRPALVSAVLVGTLGLLPWHESRERGPSRPIDLPRTIEIVPYTGSHLAGSLGYIVTPEPHPDARPWPHGMVITPPAVDGAIVQWRASPLDNLLSVLIAPLHAFGM